MMKGVEIIALTYEYSTDTTLFKQNEKLEIIVYAIRSDEGVTAVMIKETKTLADCIYISFLNALSVL